MTNLDFLLQAQTLADYYQALFEFETECMYTDFLTGITVWLESERDINTINIKAQMNLEKMERESQAIYERAKANSKFVELPCKIGDTIYIIDEGNKKVIDFTVHSINIMEKGYFEIKSYHVDKKIGILSTALPEHIGESVFFTRAEADKALERLIGGKQWINTKQ